MRPDVSKLIQDIIFAANEIESFTKGMNITSFTNSSIVLRAVERDFEIIGEAFNRISRIDDTLLDSIPDSRKIIGFRNIIAHGYDSIDERILWAAIEKHLPDLVQKLHELLNS